MTITNVKSIDIIQEDAFKHLTQKRQLTCDFGTFKKKTDVYQTPHGAYIDLYAGVIEPAISRMMNKLLILTADDLQGYKNVIDWLVQQDKNVHYLPEINLYIIIHDQSILCESNA